MNERIKTLIKESGGHNIAYEGRLGSYSYAFTDNSVEKFAELIIQKCISQIALIGISNYENDDVMWATEKSIENIREHFGMKDETN